MGIKDRVGMKIEFTWVTTEKEIGSSEEGSEHSGSEMIEFHYIIYIILFI
jgi:hypothetical protein